MTIKEIEKESGMTRANIRYYEAEGLLDPVRGKNGYREYSEDDLAILMKIKLLRSLQFSLEEIKALQTGERELSDALEEQLVRLQREKTQLEHSQEICKAMKKDGVCYQTLDAQHYLGILEQEDWQAVFQQDAAPQPQIRIPWRRYFARWLDLTFYTLVWNIFLALVLGVNIIARSESGKVLDYIASYLLMIMIEPFLLTLFGTTLGKWILGLRVTDNEGRRLTFEESRSRTWKMFSYGMGFGIPIWSQFRLWKSYKAHREEETLEWEYHSAMTLKDERGWRGGAYIGLIILLVCVYALVFRVSALPKNRGEITVAEFSENYNQLSKFYGYESGYRLDREGKWFKQDKMMYDVSVGRNAQPEFLYSQTDGVMTGMCFSVEYQDNHDWITYGYRQEMVLAVMAFCGAQEGNHIFTRELEKAVEMISEVSGKSFELSVFGVRVDCEVAYSGYQEISGIGILIPIEEQEGWYRFSFSISKEREDDHQ